MRALRARRNWLCSTEIMRSHLIMRAAPHKQRRTIHSFGFCSATLLDLIRSFKIRQMLIAAALSSALHPSTAFPALRRLIV